MKPNTRKLVSIVSSICILTNTFIINNTISTVYASDTSVVNDTTTIQKLNNLGLSSSDPYTSNLECNSDINTYNTNYPKWKRTKCLYNGNSYLYFLYTSENESKVNEILNISNGPNGFIGNTSNTSKTSSSIKTSEVTPTNKYTNSEDEISNLFDSIQLEVDSGETLIQKLKEKMGTDNVVKSDSFLQKVKNLKNKKNTNGTNKYTSKAFIEILDKLISQLDTLRSKANTSFEKGNISEIKLDKLQSVIQYLKIGITKNKTETQVLEGDDDFWSELGGIEEESGNQDVKIENKTDVIMPDNHARTINFLGGGDVNSCKEDAKEVFGPNVTKYTCKIGGGCCLNGNMPGTNGCISANPNMYGICGNGWDDIRIACGKAKDGKNKNYSNVYDLINQQAEFIKYGYCNKSENEDIKIIKINGACGSVSGQTVSTKPTYNLCTTGESTNPSLDGNTWNWTCNGIEGGSNNNCKAYIANTIISIGSSNSSSSGGGGVSCQGKRITGGTCYCANVNDDLGGAVRGSSPYTNDSDICKAAVHAGIQLPATVTVVPSVGCSKYLSSIKNGITTFSFSSKWNGSFYFQGYGNSSCGE